MGFKCGIVGLPNVGKSTLFNALTKASIAAENYPFCTIEPHVGIVPVPAPELDALAKLVSPEKVIPSTMEFVDIAGLVSGASKGEGLGNQFLGNIRETQAIAHVVRCFEDDDVIHVSSKVDPVADAQTINTELSLADIDTLEKAIERSKKRGKSGDKQVLKDIEAYQKALTHCNEGLSLRSLSLTESEAESLSPLNLLTQKPMLYVANVSEDGFENNLHLDAIKDLADKESAMVIPISAAIEAEMLSLSDEEQAEFLEELGWEAPGLHRFIHAGHTLLSLQTFYTAGPKEVRAWTVPIGATAPQAAGKIHTDFEKGFIRAEVVGYADYITYSGEAGAKDAGKWRLEGKEYIMQPDDVVHFRFNV